MIASYVAPPIANTSYILISPLLRPIASFTFFFTSSADRSILSKRSAETHSASVERILAIYGEGDIFALTTGRYRRYFEQVKRDWGDKIIVREIQGGGHFWLELESKRNLINEVQSFIDRGSV